MTSIVFSHFGDRLGLLHLRDCGRGGRGVGEGGLGNVFGEDHVLEFCGGTYLEM